MSLPSKLKASHEKAWHFALAQLQLQMSRNYFDTWVQPTVFLSLEQNVFTIGTHDYYAKKWLESRLTTTLEHLLSGILNQRIIVRFAVLQENEDIYVENIEELEISQDSENKKSDLKPEVLHRILRNALIMPERVVRIPVYLFRWLPYVGAEIIFLVIALWQERYLFTGGNSSWASCTVSSRAERIYQWAGISRARFFKLLLPGSPLGWFIRKYSGDHELNPKTGRFKKTANKYFLPGIPITPGDAEDLKKFLVNLKIGDPKAVLEVAIATPPNQILRYPIRLPSDGFSVTLPQLVTIQDVVRTVFEDRVDSELSKLADLLADHLIRTESFFTVSWYFLRNWLPILGSNAAMFILLLRKSCFFNIGTGEIRDTLWIEGGYRAIADWLGVGNPRNISNWFPPAINRGKHKANYTKRTIQEVTRQQKVRDFLSLFVERKDYRGNKNASYAWQFKVQKDDPLVPSHRLVMEMIELIVTTAEENKVLDEFLSWVNKLNNDYSRTLKNGSLHDLRHSTLLIDCPEILKQTIIDSFDTLEGSSNDCFETILKILKNFKDSYSKENTPPNENKVRVFRGDCEDNEGRKVMEGIAKWDLQKLLSRVSKINREKLLEQEDNAQSFISWLIHASSNSSIWNPYNFAISKLKEFPKRGAGGACDKLAALPPSQLMDLIAYALGTQRPLIYPGWNNAIKEWMMLFGEGKQNRVRLLADALNLQIEEIDYSWINN